MGLSWTQVICERDWIKRHTKVDGSIRRPVRVIGPKIEQCAYCGEPTIFGVYVRDDPAAVPFPSPKVE